MGSVTVLTVTGDNDPELEPTEKFRRYMYCDECGSFNMAFWIEATNNGNVERLERNARWIDRLSTVVLVSAILELLVLLIGSVSVLIMAGNFTIDYLVLALLLLTVGAYVILHKLADNIRDRIKYRGLSCGDCDAQYAYKTPFFADKPTNPRNYTSANIPPVAQSPYWETGNKSDVQPG